ncbi:MAG: zinc ribbon domain-containing protein [Chlorobiales bacterium]|nr:zinc ribbon domain-containing protein [Chlorobiales bacterium]
MLTEMLAPPESKGNTFKAVLGMKTALNVTVRQIENNLEVEAGVGIFGQHAVPTAISMLLFWPVLVTQIWGMVKQSKMDDQVMEIAETVILNSPAARATAGTSVSGKFCTNCGAPASAEAKFCSACGKPL